MLKFIVFYVFETKYVPTFCLNFKSFSFKICLHSEPDTTKNTASAVLPIKTKIFIQCILEELVRPI